MGRQTIAVDSGEREKEKGDERLGESLRLYLPFGTRNDTAHFGYIDLTLKLDSNGGSIGRAGCGMRV
jgi:hypothetical protein